MLRLQGTHCQVETCGLRRVIRNIVFEQQVQRRNAFCSRLNLEHMMQVQQQRTFSGDLKTFGGTLCVSTQELVSILRSGGQEQVTISCCGCLQHRSFGSGISILLISQFLSMMFGVVLFANVRFNKVLMCQEVVLLCVFWHGHVPKHAILLYL